MGAFYQRALICYRQRRYPMAREELERELAEVPSSADAYALTALCFAAEKAYKRARSSAEQAIALAPQNAFAHYTLAWVFVTDQKYTCRRGFSFTTDAKALRRRCLKLADTSIRDGIRLAPAAADYYGLLACIRFDLGDRRGAAEASRHGLAISPTQNDCLRVLSLVHRSRGQLEAARSFSTSAVANDPNSMHNHLLHGRTLLVLGDWRGALEHYRDAMRIDPNSPAARQGLINGLRARNACYRLIVMATAPLSFRRPRQLLAAALLVLVVVATPFLPWLAIELLRPLGIPRQFSGFIAATSLVPPLWFLSAGLWTLFMLQFDNEGKHLLTREQRFVSTILIGVGVWFWIYIGIDAFLGRSWSDVLALVFWAGVGLIGLAPAIGPPLARAIRKRR